MKDNKEMMLKFTAENTKQKIYNKVSLIPTEIKEKIH